MSFPRYPAYVDSGDQSLGMLPTHWRVNRLKSLLVEPLKYGANEAAELDDPSSPRFVRITDVAEDGSLRDETFRSLPRDVAEPYLLQEGDVLLARSGATVGKSFMYQRHWGEACFAGYLIRARLRQQLCLPQWLNYFCHSGPYWDYVLGTQIQSTIQNVSAEKYANLALPIPPVKEQSQLVAFLDRETAKIDALVAEQEQLITLLKEKRQAVISHAVTKGLDPSVPMKDSGVKWLGEVPAYWAIAALNYRYEVLLGKMLDEKKISGNHLAPYLRNVDVQWDRVNVDELPQMDFDGSDIERYGLRAGDLLVCEGGDVGRSAIWRGELTECYYQKALHRLRPRDGSTDLPRFQFYLMQTAAKLDVFTGGQGKATIAHLTAESLRRYRFPYPARAEQEQIVEYLDQAVGQFDELINEASSASQLLQERRSALISAAVTGQIDVRGLGATKEAA